MASKKSTQTEPASAVSGKQAAAASAPDEAQTDQKSTEPTAPNQPWRRFAFGAPRTTAAGLTAAVLALGLGFATMTQVRQTEKSGLQDLSQSELVSLLATVNDQAARLETELNDLRRQKTSLEAGSDTSAVRDAQKRLDQLEILNGTVGVSGPGISIQVSKGKDVTSANVLDAVQELRDAGAEAIEVDGKRVVANTWFSDQGDKVTVAGKPVRDDFTIVAIGDPHTMSTAMAIPGGVTDTLAQAGAQVKVGENQNAQITSVTSTR